MLSIWRNIAIVVVLNVFNRSPLQCCCLLVNGGNLNETGKKLRIAVCVSGQLGRFQPHHLLQGLVRPNPIVHFSFFYNLQLSPIIYSTDSHLFYNSTKYSWMSTYEVTERVTKLMSTANSQVISVHYGYSHNVSYWRNVMNGSLLPMQAFRSDDMQMRILNMYQFQPLCVQQLLSFERRQDTPFHYIIYSREDIYTFAAVNLTVLLPLLRNTWRHNNTVSEPTNANISNDTCDAISKNCLHHGGINMRFYVLTRSAGIAFLGQRLSFYKYLRDHNVVVFNPGDGLYLFFLIKPISCTRPPPTNTLPITDSFHLSLYCCSGRANDLIIPSPSERFEKSMLSAHWLNLTHCPVPFDMLPVAAARHVSPTTTTTIITTTTTEPYSSLPFAVSQYYMIYSNIFQTSY